MPVVLSMIRNSSQNVTCVGILLFCCFIASLVLWDNREIYTQVMDYTDLSTVFACCFCIVTITIFSSFINLLLLFAFERLFAFMKSRNSNVLSIYWKHLKNHECLLHIVCLDMGLVLLCFWMGLKFNWNCFKVIISASMLFACMSVWSNYDDVELSSSQNIKKSIGACWAYGAYLAFYKRILIDMPQRMSKFEDKHKITLLVKKLVIICPLSCNANGSLEGKDGNLKAVGELEEIIEDEGANYNRIYKTNVYEIRGSPGSYFAAEIPSPLATLYEMRDVMDAVILKYHRECFIETLKDCLKSDQCIILEYDDLNSPEPLHSFLLSKLEDQKFVKSFK